MILTNHRTPRLCPSALVLTLLLSLCVVRVPAVEEYPVLEIVGQEASGGPVPAGQVLDFHNGPRVWHTAINLPGDPYRSAVRSDGAFLLSRGGVLWTFRPALQGVPGEESIEQRVRGPRIPIVSTAMRQGTATLESVAFAREPDKRKPEDWGPRRADLWLLSRGGSAGRLALQVWPPEPVRLDASRTRLVPVGQPANTLCYFFPAVESLAQLRAEGIVPVRTGRVVRGWASPEGPVHPRFRSTIVGGPGGLEFDVPVSGKGEYAVALGLIEGGDAPPVSRLIEVSVEGEKARVIDLTAEATRGRPIVLLYRVLEGGDGQLRVTLRAPGGPDAPPPVLSGLWVFPAPEISGPEDEVPNPDEIVSGAADGKALAWIDAGRLEAMNRIDLVFPAGAVAARVAFPRGPAARVDDFYMLDPGKERERAEKWWVKKAEIPGEEAIVLPDSPMQALYLAGLRRLAQVGRDSYEARRALGPDGTGQTDAAVLYALANLASPAPGWGLGAETVGDLAPAIAFVHALRSALVHEDGDALHLLAGLPRAWMRPGSRLELQSIPTRFGAISLTLNVDAKGREARLEVKAAWDEPPARVRVHLTGMPLPVRQVQLGREAIEGLVELREPGFTLRMSLGTTE